MVSFLSKLGSVLLAVTNAFVPFEPILEKILPQNQAGVVKTVSNDLAAMANIIVQVETVAQQLNLAGNTLTGQQKLQMAIALITPVVTQSNLIAGKKIADPALMQKAIAEYAQATVDLLQAIHQDEVAHVVAENVIHT
jgi:hypothetical protein